MNNPGLRTREWEVLLRRVDFQTARPGQHLRLRTAGPSSAKYRLMLVEVEVWGEKTGTSNIYRTTENKEPRK